MYFGSETQDLTTTLNSEIQLVPSLTLPPELAFAGLAYALKRMIDMLGALIGMLLLSPVMLGVAILIRLDSSGPILFRQERLADMGSSFRYSSSEQWLWMPSIACGTSRSITSLSTECFSSCVMTRE